MPANSAASVSSEPAGTSTGSGAVSNFTEKVVAIYSIFQFKKPERQL
jgi:hypothetical protein